MKIAIVMPVHNEETFLTQCLNSLVTQTKIPDQFIIVNDNSTDNSAAIINTYCEQYPFIKTITISSGTEHMPGSKVIQAFNKGLALLSVDDFDIICKYDSDLIFPNNYLEEITKVFTKNTKAGIVGGYIYEQNNETGEWLLNHTMNKDHIRGALKAYSKACFKSINGLKNSIGWDTVDELLALYHGYSINAIENLNVKHLRPTGKSYNKKAKKMQGEAMYKMRYGLLLTSIASAKMALGQKKPKVFFHNLSGYFEHLKQKTPYVVSAQEGAFIRKYRFQGIFKKLLGKTN